MKLWHCRESRSLRPLWALEEMDIPYELAVLPFPPRVRHREFLEINALGTVPYFEDGDVRMTESTGICHYLVEKYDRREFGLRATEPEYGDYVNWLHHSDATLTFPLTIVMRYRVMEPDRAPAAAADYAKWFLARLRLLDARLAEGREFLCGNRFTIADIAVTYALYLARYVGLADQLPATALGYLERMTQRPAFIRANELR
jgi:glutathione S-transferase